MRTCGLGACAMLVAGVAHADGWDMEAMVGNDMLDSVLSHTDDNGFTNDVRIALHHRRGDLAFGGSIFDRMITSKVAMRRCDLVELFATAAWFPDDHVTLEVRAGPTVAGSLGGLWVQSRWHRLTGTGPSDPRRLPTIYMHDTSAAAVTGMRVEAGAGGLLRAYGVLDGQLAIGDTGVTFAETTGGLRASYRIGPVELGVFGELALGRYDVEDPALAVPAAYRPGWQVDQRIGVRLGVDRYRVAFEYHTNETSSGEAFSEITFERR